jgi:hypothetical protein
MHHCILPSQVSPFLTFCFLVFLTTRVAYTYTGGCSTTNCGWLVVVNQDYCQSTTTLSHEIAHNLGFQHSGRKLVGNRFDQYRDQTGLMGFSDGADDSNMCFNAPKSYQTGWYESRDVTLVSNSMFTHTIGNPWTADLVGVAEYGVASGDQKVTIKLDHASAPHYIGFNRKTGITADTRGPADKVVVSTQNEDDQSWLVAALDAYQVYDIADYFGPGKDARIQNRGYITSGEARVAQIAIYRLGTCSKYEYEFALDLYTDGRASDTSWVVQNDSGDTVLSGSGYSNLKKYAEVDCLPAGNYTFNMYDASSDGIDQDNGGYIATLDGRVIATGDEVSTASVNSRTFEAGCGGSDLSLFELDLTTESSGSDTSWKVEDALGEIATFGTGYTNPSSNYARFCLPDGNYSFTISDDGTDGDNGDGSYTAYNQKAKIGTSDSFTEPATYDFIVDFGAPVVDPTICLDDITLVKQVGNAAYDSLPIRIVSQDTTSVTIEVSNTWSGDVLSNVFTKYDDTNFRTTCPEMTQVTKTAPPALYTIACMAIDAVAHVDIFVSEASFATELGDNAVVPLCCHPEADFVAPTVQYIFMLQCVSQCPEEGIQRGLLRGSSQTKLMELLKDRW